MLDLAELAGIDGVVCSPHELELLTKELHYINYSRHQTGGSVDDEKELNAQGSNRSGGRLLSY